MKPNAHTKTLYITGLLCFLLLLFYDRFLGINAFVVETLIFMVVFSIAYWKFKALRLNNVLFGCLFLAMILHSLGAFGWYKVSPLPLAWDHVTHFIPMMIFAMIFFHFLEPFMSTSLDAKTLMLVFIALLASLGVGSLVENAEFLGFNLWGFGEGGLQFGQGDAFPGQEVADQIESFVGGWFNAMWDLVNNLLGALVGVMIMMIKRKKNLQRNT